MNSNFRKLLYFIITVCMFQNIVAKNIKSNPNYNCDEKNVTLKTEVKSKYKYFFFRKTNHKKVKRIDEVIDENGKIIIKTTMRSNEYGDQYEFREFHRLVIIGKEIHEVFCETGKENGKLIIYNFCGEKKKELDMNSEELLEKYKF